MQLLRDNLTLWTSSDNAEGEAAPGAAEPVKAEEGAAAAAAPAEKSEEAPKTEEAAPAS
jgi:14-3-3 protein epsilon